jgi:hypothetical protein
MEVRMKRASILAALLFVAGCTAVRASRAPDVAIGQYKTFAFAPHDPRVDRSPTSQVIQNQIARNLAASGVVPAQGAAPDFLVAYNQRLEQVWSPDYVFSGGWLAWDWYGWPYPGYTYTQRTISIDFIDPRTNRVFWRGTAVDVVQHPENPSTKKVAKSVDKVMGAYRTSLAKAPGPTTL